MTVGDGGRVVHVYVPWRRASLTAVPSCSRTEDRRSPRTHVGRLLSNDLSGTESDHDELPQRLECGIR